MTMEYKNHRSFPLRLSPSMWRQADLLARRAGMSIHYFIVLAIIEKLSRAGIVSIPQEQPLAETSSPAS